MKTEITPELILTMEYDGKFTVNYSLNDGTSSAFRVLPKVGAMIVGAVNCHQRLLEASKRLADRAKDTYLCSSPELEALKNAIVEASQ